MIHDEILIFATKEDSQRLRRNIIFFQPTLNFNTISDYSITLQSHKLHTCALCIIIDHHHDSLTFSERRKRDDIQDKRRRKANKCLSPTERERESSHEIELIWFIVARERRE